MDRNFPLKQVAKVPRAGTATSVTKYNINCHKRVIFLRIQKNLNIEVYPPGQKFDNVYT
jgi:hypothetical protein